MVPLVSLQGTGPTCDVFAFIASTVSACVPDHVRVPSTVDFVCVAVYKAYLSSQYIIMKNADGKDTRNCMKRLDGAR